MESQYQEGGCLIDVSFGIAFCIVCADNILFACVFILCQFSSKVKLLNSLFIVYIRALKLYI